MNVSFSLKATKFMWDNFSVYISRLSILELSCIDKHCRLWVPYLILFILILIILIREMEWRLDKEGREYHHYEDFCKLYRSEILNLNRMLDMLSKNGMLPGNLNLNFSVSNVSVFHWYYVLLLSFPKLYIPS